MFCLLFTLIQETWKCGHSGGVGAHCVAWFTEIRSELQADRNIQPKYRRSGHDKADRPSVRELQKKLMETGRQAAGVGAHMARTWNGSESHLCVGRGNRLVGATVNCQYQVQVCTRAAGCMCTGFKPRTVKHSDRHYTLHVPQTFGKEWAEILGSLNV